MIADPLGSHEFAYVHTDIPAGMTIREWRVHRAAERDAARSRPAGAGARLDACVAIAAWRGRRLRPTDGTREHA